MNLREWQENFSIRNKNRLYPHLAPTIRPVDIDALLDDLFSRQSTITRRDLELAAGLILSKHRLSDLLRDLVASGKLIKEGRGNQTRYRKP